MFRRSGIVVVIREVISVSPRLMNAWRAKTGRTSTQCQLGQACGGRTTTRMRTAIIGGIRSIAQRIVYDTGSAARGKENPRMRFLPVAITWLPPVTARCSGGKNVTPIMR